LMCPVQWRSLPMPAFPGCCICATVLAGIVCIWPFDGWEVSGGKSVLCEVYPSLWSKEFPREDRTGDQHDAYSVAAMLRQVDCDGRLHTLLKPEMLPGQYPEAQLEGWILGVL